MPWAMISSGVTEQYLWREHERCYQSVTTPDCRTHCNGCGANLLLGEAPAMAKLRLLFHQGGAGLLHLAPRHDANLPTCVSPCGAAPQHSNGFHPHPIISIVLPLPVGQSSDCELLDFETVEETDGAGIAEKAQHGSARGLARAGVLSGHAPRARVHVPCAHGWSCSMITACPPAALRARCSHAKR